MIKNDVRPRQEWLVKTFWRFGVFVSRLFMATAEQKRATVYLDADLHRAIKTKATLSSTTISKLISEALKESLRDDAEDIKALEDTKNEPSYSLEEVLKELDLEQLAE